MVQGMQKQEKERITREILLVSNRDKDTSHRLKKSDATIKIQHTSSPHAT